VSAGSGTFSILQRGDPLPHVRQRTGTAASFPIDTMAGRYIVLCFFASLADPDARQAIGAVQKHRDLFDDRRACFFGVSIDPQDEVETRFVESAPGLRILWDFDGAVSKACCVLTKDSGSAPGPKKFRRCWLVIDPTLHVLATFGFGGDACRQVFEFLRRLPEPAAFAGFEIPAPVLVLPHVLEPDLCSKLIALHVAEGGSETGVFRRGTYVIDPSVKRRKDITLTDGDLCRTLVRRIERRVVPEMRRLFFMQITRIERYIVSCYAAEDGGHFQPHRDNVGVTAHRRFAVSINLNADFEGGAIEFPEYNCRGIKAPPGWAAVFPCAILHSVSRVTSGRRYAFLPFLYDEEGAKILEAAQRAAKTSNASVHLAI
jgi:peroxiredoxin/predicted 2-oxoglutarate/Fe(II)-dependent dioxygenase YbiX